MRRAYTSALIVTIGVLLFGGCGPSEMSRSSMRNQEAMARLQPGMTPKEVAELMRGDLYDKDFYKGKNGEEVLVYKYLTHPPPPTGMRYSVLRSTIDADLTPLVFVNNALEGWGWSYLETASIKYEFVVKYKNR